MLRQFVSHIFYAYVWLLHHYSLVFLICPLVICVLNVDITHISMIKLHIMLWFSRVMLLASRHPYFAALSASICFLYIFCLFVLANISYYRGKKDNSVFIISRFHLYSTWLPSLCPSLRPPSLLLFIFARFHFECAFSISLCKWVILMCTWNVIRMSNPILVQLNCLFNMGWNKIILNWILEENFKMILD